MEDNTNQSESTLQASSARELTDHIVSGDQAVQLKVEVLDGPGAGGAYHAYRITGMTDPDWDCDLFFQNGPIKEAGVNGITHEALLAVLIDRLRGFQTGPFACQDNARALAHLKRALRHLQNRTLARIARGVEGTNKE